MSLVSGLLNQTITSIYSTATDGYGVKTQTLVYSTVACRWQEKIGLVIDKNNEEKQYTVEAWVDTTHIDTTITINVDYDIVFGEETYVVIGTEKRYDINGVWDHTKLYLV